jgi:hypothetical protein
MQIKLEIIQEEVSEAAWELMSQVWDGSVVTGPLGGVVMFVS